MTVGLFCLNIRVPEHSLETAVKTPFNVTVFSEAYSLQLYLRVPMLPKVIYRVQNRVHPSFKKQQ